MRDVISLVPLHQAPAAAVEDLLDAAFGADRRARTAYRLRAGALPIPALSLAALDEEGALVGSLQSWPVDLVDPAGGRHPLVLVGPVAVQPGLQRSGIGRMMMDAMLAAADLGDPRALMLIGDPEYYGRFFGFTADATGGWRLPGPFEPHRLLARIAPGTSLPAVATIAPADAFAPGRLIA
jgi:predicted N-acetyltransferase YhbS